MKRSGLALEVIVQIAAIPRQYAVYRLCPSMALVFLATAYTYLRFEQYPLHDLPSSLLALGTACPEGLGGKPSAPLG